MKKIARVFPSKTNMCPTDPLAFFGPPTIEAMAMDIDEVVGKKFSEAMAREEK